jgi:hypothetical protein
MVHPDVIKSSNVLDVRQEFVQEYYDRSVHTSRFPHPSWGYSAGGF